MSTPLPFSAGALLESIEGISYAADEAGIILGFSRGPFLPTDDDGEATPWDSGQAIGTCLFDLVQGDDVRASYRALHRAVWLGRPHSVGFEYRCDAPAIERRMRMALSRITVELKPCAVLYQSIVISETPRVPIPLFSAAMLTSRIGLAAGRHIVTLCSYCQRVAWPDGRGGPNRIWIEPVEYYQRSRDPAVVISHGICEACFERVIATALHPTAPDDPA
jgi:hypothetical protein